MCVSDGYVWPPRQRAEIRERIASESLQKIRAKFYEIAGHVWVELKLLDFSKSYTQGSRMQSHSQDKLR